MTRTSHTPQVKGIVTLTFRDADTLEITNEIEQTNAITTPGLTTLLMLQSNNYYLSNSQNYLPDASNVAISDRISSSGAVTDVRGPYVANYDPNTYLTMMDINQQEWTFNEGSPDFAEKVGRFNPPAGADRTINTIYLTSAAFKAFAVAALNTPCIQTTSEVLDITYRLQFYYQANDPSLFPTSFDYGRNLARSNVHTERYGGYPSEISYQWHSVPTDGVEYEGLVTGTTSLVNVASILVRRRTSHDKVEYTIDRTVAQDIGVVMKTVGYGSLDIYGNYFNDAQNPRSVAWAPIAPDSFANKPIQTIHNHNANAIEWGLDVDYLANSQGSLTVDGSAWTDLSWPEFYRIDHTQTGEVGTSRYMMRTRRTVGFEDNTYETDRGAYNYSHWEASDGSVSSIRGGHGLRTWYQKEEYDEQTFVSWDAAGITVNNLNKCDARNFDATTAPALPVTNVRQVAVDSSGSIWVACSNSGLYVVVDPYGTPVITKMTTATNSLPAGGENMAYGVAVANNGDIIALVENGLIRTTNPTGATPIFATESFTYTGITDANWSNVLYIRVDRESPEYELALIAEVTADTKQTVVWWSTAATAGIDGPVSGTYVPSAQMVEGFGRVACSARGSLWTRTGPNSYNAYSQGLVFGTATLISLTPHQIGHSHPLFFYDYYDTPYTIGATSTSCGVVSASDKFYGGHDGQVRSTFSNYNGATFAFQTGSGKGFWLNHDQSNTNQGGSSQVPESIKMMGPKTTEFMDPLNGQHSPQEELCWDKYHWDGASWVLGYYADATDTATHVSGPYPADRHNFDTEDHTFTGRSMVDVTGAFAASNFTATATATFAFKLIPEAKLSTALDTVGTQQEKQRVILDISDDTQQFQIMWDDDIQGSVTIVEDGTPTIIAATPVNSATYRLVVVVAGTSVLVYLDGVQIGSTVTLSTAYDWDNSDGKLKAFVGCEVYNWDYPQRNTPWQNNFYRGVMENVQLWNVAWNGTDVTNDFGDIDGVIGSQPAANMVARYQLTQSLATLETKLTHVGAEALLNGITIAFADGVSPDAFVAGDYHTFGVVDGILKDNAISFVQKYSIYFHPIDHTFADFKNGSNTSVVEAAPTAIVDEPAIFTLATNPNQSEDSNINSANNTYVDCIWAAPGQLSQGDTTGDSYVSDEGGLTAQPITGDGYFQVKPQHGDEKITFGLTSTPSINHSCAFIDFGVRLHPDGTVDIVEANVVVSAGVATYSITDNFRVTRTGTAVTYQKVVGGTPTTIYTSVNTSAGTVYGRVHLNEEGYGVMDAVVTYTRPGYMMIVGDPIALTGAADSDFRRVETLVPETLDINIDGSPATVVISETWFDDMTIPGPGEVVVNGETGWLVFNSADVGKAVTGTVTVIFDKT